MTSYLAWNNALASRFFRPDASGQPVYFFVTEDVIAEVGRTVGGGLDEFIGAIRGGPPGTTRPGHCQRALQVAEGWRDHGFEYPPYVAYLGLFVLAGGQEGNFAPQSYYPGLWALLGEDRSDTPPSFERMLELWDDLERWSIRDRGGDLGLFEARIVGGKIHIGLPLAQTVLTGGERHALPRIFADAGLDAGRSPSTRELRRALSLHGRQWLRPRTMSSIERGSEGFVGALLDVVADDFLSWDGTTTATKDGEAPQREVHAGLRLCLSLDRVAGEVLAVLRCQTKKEFPEDGLRLSGVGDGEFVCAEFIAGWSTPLADPETGAPYEPPASTWHAGVAASDSATGWQLRLASARVRVFVDGRDELLPGLVEVLELPQDGPFYLAFATSAEPALGAWLSSECEGWQPIAVIAGLPAQWVLGSVRAAKTDRGLRDVRPELGFPDRLSMRLVGGIRAAPGNSFFSFAPPQVALDGASSTDRLFCQGSILERDAGSSMYPLPDDPPVDTRIGLEVWRGDEAIRRASLYLLSGFSWRLERGIVSVDRYGFASAEGSIAGAASPPTPEDPFPLDLLRTPGLAGSAGRIYFIGREAGQISVWPVEDPPEWQAVWAIPFGKRGRAIFCGTTIAEAAPLPRRNADRSRVRLWHDVLWRRRRDISPPLDREQKVLWRRYRDALRD